MFYESDEELVLFASVFGKSTDEEKLTCFHIDMIKEVHWTKFCHNKLFYEQNYKTLYYHLGMGRFKGDFE